MRMRMTMTMTMRKKNKEIKIERLIIDLSIKHNSIVQKWNSKKL